MTLTDEIAYIENNMQGKLINLHPHLSQMEQEYYRDIPGMIHPDNVSSGNSRKFGSIVI